MELPHYPVIPFLGMYPREIKPTFIPTEICLQIFIAVFALLLKSESNTNVHVLVMGKQNVI